MAFPVLLRKLFGNDGAGPKLREDIMPKDYLPTAGGGTVTGNLKIIGGYGALNLAPAADNAYTEISYSSAVARRGFTRMSETDTAISLVHQLYVQEGVANQYPVSVELYYHKASDSGVVKVSGNEVLTRVTGLPLGGGTMTGQIKTSVLTAVARTDTNQYLTLVGGTDTTNGARLVLSGKDRASNEGRWSLVAQNGTTEKTLTGAPDGTATWAGTFKATAFQISSDLRLKSDLVTIDSALDKVDALSAYTYNIKGDESGRRAGVIAQDVLDVLPEAVRLVEANPEDSESEEHYAVDYNGVVALLVNAIKELKAEVEELKNGKRVS